MALSYTELADFISDERYLEMSRAYALEGFQETDDTETQLFPPHSNRNQLEGANNVRRTAITSTHALDVPTPIQNAVVCTDSDMVITGNEGEKIRFGKQKGENSRKLYLSGRKLDNADDGMKWNYGCWGWKVFPHQPKCFLTACA